MSLVRACLVALVASMAWAADPVWVGLSVGEIGDKGKVEINYMAGQVDSQALERLRDGVNPEGFLQIDNLLFIDSEAGTYEMNSDTAGSLEESDKAMIRMKSVVRVVWLKDDPRKIYRKR